MFEDEARFGRLPVVRTAWAPPGVRPVVQAAVERQFRYVYGAVSPFEGDVDWMIADSMKTVNMNLFLQQISEAHPRDYILLVTDGAGSHKTPDLKLPDNMAVLLLPPYSPELNPTENLWDHTREKVCANVLFDTLDHVVDRVVAELDRLARSTSQVVSMFLHPWIMESL
jgi:hypothetical protein